MLKLIELAKELKADNAETGKTELLRKTLKSALANIVTATTTEAGRDMEVVLTEETEETIVTSSEILTTLTMEITITSQTRITTTWTKMNTTIMKRMDTTTETVTKKKRNVVATMIEHF